MAGCDGALGFHSARVGRTLMSSTWVSDVGEDPTPLKDRFNWTTTCFQLHSSGEFLVSNGWHRRKHQVCTNELTSVATPSLG